MSYRRTYSATIHYRGTVSYPASQNGGTASYSGSEPVYITIDVDTNSFDASIGRCDKEVEGLAAAVVATKTAQVKSKVESSKRIAHTIVKGFFDYVGADLSQKMKELASKCEALFVALMGHKDNCLSKKEQMQNDYNRISKRYSKIFVDLDNEITSRIKQLDKATFQFADTAQSVIDRNQDTSMLSISTISANENLKLETILSCSHVKQLANNLITKADDYLRGTYHLTNSVRNMLSGTNTDDELMLPVIFIEATSSSNGKTAGICKTDEKLMPFGKETDSQLVSCFLSENICWENIDADDFGKLVSYFNTYVQNDKTEDRIVTTMLKLLNNNAIQTIKQ